MTTDDDREAAWTEYRSAYLATPGTTPTQLRKRDFLAGYDSATRWRPATEPSEGEVEAAVAVLRAAPAVSTATVRAALRAARGVGQ